jgi:hypothetical protein
MFAFISIMATSCTKEDNNPSHDNFFQAGNESPVVLNLGLIEDYGTVTDAVRHMHTTFINQGYVLDTKTGDISGIGSLVNIGFYTDADGMIPTGTYIFSNSLTKLPFTFDSGYITENYNLSTLEGHLHQITNGTIIVFHDGDTYDFTFDCDLNTGSQLTGTFKGTMEYFDVSGK